MFGQNQYFSQIRKYVALVGNLFDDIYIEKQSTDANTEVSLVRVPITYGPKDKMLSRIVQDSNIDRQSATLPLPMISFEIGQMTYDNERKITTTGRVTTKNQNNPSTLKYQYNPVPYNIDFKVFVYAKNETDGTKIIEQILPYFTPDWTTSVNFIPEMNIQIDIPIYLRSVSYSDNYDEKMTQRRAIIWTLDLVLMGLIYGPIKTAPIIKFANINVYTGDPKTNSDFTESIQVKPGLDANGNPTNFSNNSVNTYIISVDSDYGFITTVENK